MTIHAIYLIFCALSALVFLRVSVRPAILIIFLGGWLLLPVGNYPTIEVAASIPWWISGLAVPSDMLVTKAWIAPAAAFAGAALFDFQAIRNWRPGYLDFPMALWCLWPLCDGMLAPLSNPSPWFASLYIMGIWGLPWLLGRIWFADDAGRMQLVEALSYSGLACLPFAIAESLSPPFIYDVFFGAHPFRLDGASRYFGYRPLGFFENGNQYGIWVALSALAAIWLAAARRHTRHEWLFIAIAGVTATTALASQSVGAIALLIVGLVLLLLWRFTAAKVALLILIISVALIGATHLSGIVPLRVIAQNTAIGEQTIEFFQALGRRSFLWRLSQDIKVMEVIHASPLLGTTIWDWWRPYATRPWGLALLLIGQFGLIGLALSLGNLLLAGCSALFRIQNINSLSSQAVTLPLSLIVILALADALLNSFFYFPAILAAGAVAARHRPEVPKNRSGF